MTSALQDVFCRALSFYASLGDNTFGKTQNKHGKICRIYHTRHPLRRDYYFHLPDTDMQRLYAGFMDGYRCSQSQQRENMQPPAA